MQNERASHLNSSDAYHETTETRAKRTADVFEAFIRFNRPMTDREVCSALGYKDMNAVRPRMTELIQQGVLIECGKVRDYLTGRRVRQCTVKTAEHQLAFA